MIFYFILRTTKYLLIPAQHFQKSGVFYELYLSYSGGCLIHQYIMDAITEEVGAFSHHTATATATATSTYNSIYVISNVYVYDYV